MRIPTYYLAVGSYDNWRNVFAKANRWGLPENKFRTWNRLEKGDIVFFYVETPLSAVVGHGVVLSKFYSEERFFAEDWGKVSE